MRHSLIAVGMAFFVAAGAAGAETTKEAALAKAQGMVKQLGSGLKTELQAAIKTSGFDGAVTACGDIAVARADQISEESDAMIHRVSLKLRNPANAPDDYEKGKLEQMDKDLAAGALKEAYVEVVEENGAKSLRFLKPILTNALCLNCHGSEAKIRPEVASALSRLYPDDKARGYEENQVRGAFSVSVPMGR